MTEESADTNHSLPISTDTEETPVFDFLSAETVSTELEIPLSSKKQRKNKKSALENPDPAFYKETPVGGKGSRKKANKVTEKDLLDEYLENEWHESNDAIIQSMNAIIPKERDYSAASLPRKETARKEPKRTDKKEKVTKKGKEIRGQKEEDAFVKPKTKSQEEFVNLLKNKANKIIIVTGPAGTGKTLLATEHGIRAFLTDEYDKMVFTRPSVSVDEDLGFLPGTLEEKMAPWIRPIYDVLYEHISPKDVEFLIEEKRMEIAPLGFMRGRTFKNTWIVADEMQNSTPSQMKMLLTRLGENSRLIVTGDLEQYDRVAGGGINGLEDFLRRFYRPPLSGGASTDTENQRRRNSGICAFQFSRSDIQREEVVKEVLSIYG